MTGYKLQILLAILGSAMGDAAALNSLTRQIFPNLCSFLPALCGGSRPTEGELINL